MILRITDAEISGQHSLKLKFNDGTKKTVNVTSLLDGPVFEPLKDPNYFARATLDAVCGTVVCPNGVDFAPEALYELTPEGQPTAI